MAIDLGDTHTSSIEVWTAPPELGGTLLNPGTCTLTVTAPDGTTTTPAPVNTSTGKFKLDYVTTMAGRVLFRWVTTAPATAHTDEINVQPADPGFIVSLDEARAHLNWSGVGTSGNEEELRSIIAAASVLIEGVVGPVARRTITGERHYPNSSGSVWLSQPPVISVASATPVTGGTALVVGDLYVSPYGEVRYASTYAPLPWGEYAWTYVAGRTIVPPNIAMAAKVTVMHLWRSQRGASGLPLQGELGEPQPTLPYALPNGAMQLLARDAAPVIA